jgi:ADP-heptose:LPS heptosyltransferase
MLYFTLDSIILAGISKPSPKKFKRRQVLIIYNLALGDDIMFLGVAASLYEAFPPTCYELTLICQKGFEALFTNIFDHVIGLDFSGAVTNLTKRRRLFSLVRQKYFDIAIDPIGCESATTNVLVMRAVCSTVKIGVLDTTLPNIQLTDRERLSVYNEIYKINRPHLHLIECYSDFFHYLGAYSCIAHPANLPSVHLDFELPSHFFIIFPAASMGVKRWPPERFADIAKIIYEHTHWQLLLCGTEQDRPSIEAMVSLMDSEVPMVNCIGKTSILQFVSVIGQASCVVTNDTSAYHIAVAKQVPTFLICGGYTYHRYAKYSYARLGYRDPYLITHKMNCFDCNNYCCRKLGPSGIFPCIELIDTKTVADTILNVIS